MQKKNLLKKYFGYKDFREGQESIIDHLLDGRDCLAIMPTGGGKSICYQLPSLMFSGMTLVISPLIALMKDQVEGLLENGISATYLNSTLSASENKARLNEAKQGAYRLIYVAPERLDMLGPLDVDMVAVDEAHCISQWGHDFRPSYHAIPKYINGLKKRPVVAAFTATATKKVVEEIKSLLTLRDPYEKTTGFDRKNLFYEVVKPKDKWTHLLAFLKNQSEEACGIVYCSTRKTVESLFKKLSEKKIMVGMYHGGMATDDRNAMQNAFMSGHLKLMVATNAFGMGIDKPDVRFVIHYNMPGNMEAYYQEAGRAGRDGLDSTCVLLYSPSDIIKQKMLISNEGDRQMLLLDNLQQLVNYCHSDRCLRSIIVSYFGEKTEAENCGSCGNCVGENPKEDVSVEAQKILSCVYRTKERFGLSTIIQVLRGSKNAKIIQWGLDQQSTYGLLKAWTEGAIRELAMHLIATGDLVMTADQFPILKLNSGSAAILKGNKKVLIRKEAVKKEKEIAKKLPLESHLYDQLVALRKQISEEKKVPPYVIFHNTALEEMAQIMPDEKVDFLSIKGVGEKKYESYGEAFIEVIKNYRRTL